MNRQQYVSLNECSPMMRKAASMLKANGVRFQIKTVHHIKVGELNFYPTRGTIFRDGDAGALKQNGLEAFLKLVRPREIEDDVGGDELPAGSSAERNFIEADGEKSS
ncbi:MAG TPA: hypothetical protein VGN91_15630 [Bosea sp. (in: a-proteobacteria)]|jgi:hypothetical protein|nr:hypothetical protein [Bosea sp. (in: a-proteobacteria)]